MAERAIFIEERIFLFRGDHVSAAESTLRRGEGGDRFHRKELIRKQPSALVTHLMRDYPIR